MAKNKKQKLTVSPNVSSTRVASATTVAKSRISPQQLIARYGFWAVAILVLLLPYAVPAIYDALAIKMSWSRFYYLDTPVSNQWFALEFGIILVLFVYSIMRIFYPPKTWLRNALTYVGIGFGVAQFISCCLSANPVFALKTATPMFLCILLFFAIGTFDIKRNDILKFPLWVVLSLIPISLYALAQSRGWDFLPYVPWGTNEGDYAFAANEGKQAIASTFGHPNYMGAYMAPLLFWALYYTFVRSTKMTLRVLCGLSAVLMLVAMLVGGTRGPLLGVFVGLVVFYINMAFLPRFRRLLLFCAGVGVFISLLVLFVPNPFVSVNFPIIERLLGSKEMASRFYYWIISIEMFWQYPWFGVGAGGFNLYFWDFLNTFQHSAEGPKYAFIVSDVLNGKNPGFTHNDYLQFLSEGGLVTIIFFLGLWSTLFTQCWQTCFEVLKRGREDASIVCATFLVSFVSIAVDCFFNFSFHIPISLLWFWVMAAIWIIYRETLLSSLPVLQSAETPPDNKEPAQNTVA